MGLYTEDGGVVSSKLPVSERGGGQKGHNSMFGLFRGIIIRAIFPNDKDSYTGDRMEYVIRVRGQEYPNCIDMRKSGGVFDYSERVRSITEKSFTGELSEGEFNENLDGEHVYVMFVEGKGDIPIIIGAATHPKQYVKASKDQAQFEADEFNGLEIGIDKDGSYTVKQVGLKDKDGTILNPDAVSSVIKLDAKTGDIEMNPFGLEDLTSLRIKFTKASKQVDIDAQGNSIVMGAGGIKTTDKNGNIVEMKSGAVNITVSGDAKVAVSGKADISTGGDTKVTAGGNVVLTGSKVEMNGSSGMVLTTVTDPVVDLITGTPTVGVPTVMAG